MRGKRIGRMRRGDFGYTVPWALKDGELRKDYRVYKAPRGTVQLEVTCLGRHKYETFDRNTAVEAMMARRPKPMPPRAKPLGAKRTRPEPRRICSYCGRSSESVGTCKGCGAQ